LNPVTAPPPETTDTTEFRTYIAASGWAYDYGLYDIEVIGNKIWLSCYNDHYILISQDSGMTFTKVNTNGVIAHRMHILHDGLKGFLYDSILLKLLTEDLRGIRSELMLRKLRDCSSLTRIWEYWHGGSIDTVKISCNNN